MKSKAPCSYIRGLCNYFRQKVSTELVLTLSDLSAYARKCFLDALHGGVCLLVGEGGVG